MDEYYEDEPKARNAYEERENRPIGGSNKKMNEPFEEIRDERPLTGAGGNGEYNLPEDE